MVKLIARQDLTGDYGTVHEGDIFEVREEDAAHYEAAGLAFRYFEPRPSFPAYQTKVIVPEQTKRRRDFRA